MDAYSCQVEESELYLAGSDEKLKYLSTGTKGIKPNINN